jgi:hypothetical protein
MEATLQVLGVTGFFTGALAFVIRAWEALFQRSRFEADVDWIVNRGPIVLSFVIMNTGHRKDGIREIRLATEDEPEGGGWIPRPGVWEHLLLCQGCGCTRDALAERPRLGATRRVLMRDLYGLFDTEAGAELILSGSQHIYERYARLNKDGNTVTNNTAPRQFVVGTGGANPPGSLPTDSTAPDPISAGFDSGVLELRLYDADYDYKFVGTLDNGDSGTGLYQDPSGGGFSNHTDSEHECNNDPTV